MILFGKMNLDKPIQIFVNYTGIKIVKVYKFFAKKHLFIKENLLL